MQNTTLAPPRLARGVDRDRYEAPESTVDGGVNPAAVDCRKLRGPARDMCYQAMALNAAQHAAQQPQLPPSMLLG